MPITAGAVVVVWLLIATNPFGQQLGADINGNLLVGYKLAVVCAVAFAVVVILRFALEALGGADPLTAASNPDIATRSRIAPVVIGIGTAGIVVLGLSIEDFAKHLAMEWASLPMLTTTQGARRIVWRGETYCAGDKLNRALVPPDKVEEIDQGSRCRQLRAPARRQSVSCACSTSACG